MTLGIEVPLNVVLTVTMVCLFMGALLVDCLESGDDDDMDGMV